MKRLGALLAVVAALVAIWEFYIHFMAPSLRISINTESGALQDKSPEAHIVLINTGEVAFFDCVVNYGIRPSNHDLTNSQQIELSEGVTKRIDSVNAHESKSWDFPFQPKIKDYEGYAGAICHYRSWYGATNLIRARNPDY